MPADALPIHHERSLTWRASLNLVQSILDYSAKLVVGLVVVPILVTGLGRSLFGVWEMLGRLVGYMESTDGRPTQALRLVVSNQQSLANDQAKRRLVGSALVVWLCFLPLWLVAGALLIWLAPVVTKSPPALHSTVRLGCGLMMAAILVTGLASLPESVLRGMNLGYKRMGLQAGLSLAGGALLAGAVYAGLGLPGVAAAGTIVAGLTGLCFFLLVRGQVPWFGVERPNRDEIRTLLRMSLWIAAGDLVAKLLLASDVLVLGMVLSAGTVTTYVLTGYAARLAINLYSLAADAAMPGIAGIIGGQSYRRAALLRRELLAITSVFVAAAGTTILLWNRSFVHLWVGSENYAGTWTNLLLVLVAVQTAFIRCDAYLIDAALQPGRRVRVSLIAAVATLSLTVLLTWHAGMVGLCLGILGGRATQMVWYPGLVRECFARVPELSLAWLLRPLTTMAILFVAAAYLGQSLMVDTWMVWAAGVMLTALVVLAVMLAAGLPADLRAAVVGRTAEMASRLGVSQPRFGA
jgi:O-antigen/teichoic acid export membrane protein